MTIRRLRFLPLSSLALLVPLLLALPGGVAAQSACGAYTVVDTGDSLVEIAERCGVTLPALLAANPGVRDRTDLNVGDRLRIPDPRAEQPSPVEACGPSYSVRTGDTVAEIAEKCGLTIPLLLAANPPLPEPLGIHVGLTVRIPAVPREAVEDPATLTAPGRAIERRVEAGAAARAAGAAGAEEAAGATPATEPAPEAAVTEAAAPEAAAREPTASEELMEVKGTLEAGDPCPLVRGADGTTWAVVGTVNDAFAPGEAVVLVGVAADPGLCQTEPALELRILYRARR